LALEEQIRKEYERKEKNLRKAKRTNADWVQQFSIDEQDGFASSSDSDHEAEGQTHQRVARRPANRPIKHHDKEEKNWEQREKDRNEREDKEEDKERKQDTKREGGILSRISEQPIRWKRRNSLGKGTFGEVILGMNLGTHKLMAVKEIDLSGSPCLEQTVS
jgi:hypothetical protein